MKRHLAAAAGLALLAACAPPAAKQDAPPPPPPPPAVLTEAEATQIANAAGAGFASGDVAQVMAAYHPNVVAFSLLNNDLMTTEASNKADAEAFLKLQPKMTLNARKIQVLDADTFIDSSVVTVDVVKNGKPTWFVARITDVYQKQADGGWKIVNEHSSTAPTPVKTRPAPLTPPADATAAAPDMPPLGGVRPSGATAPTDAPADAPKPTP